MRGLLPTFRARQPPFTSDAIVVEELGSFSGPNTTANEQKYGTLADSRDDVLRQRGEDNPRRESDTEDRPFFHKYFFRRPRLLQYYENGELVDSHGHRSSVDVYEHLVDDTSGDPKVQRGELQYLYAEGVSTHCGLDFLNLFIDLLWAGIISNISENFVNSAFDPGSSWGLAFMEFAILLLTAFKMWNYLRKFLNSFFNKDLLQSMFIIWILVVALYFGNQAPNFLKPGGRAIIIWTCQ